jgi:tetratricopeptide (TPR) repeat protein
MSTLRTSILGALAAGRELEAELARASDDSPPPEPGRWTARDHLAHLAAWREHAAAVLDAARTGAPPPVVHDEDERNAEIHAETRGLSAAEVADRAARSYDRLLRALEACSDDDLLKPRGGGSDAPAWQTVPGNGETHVAQHLVYWHVEHGDEAAAERVARRLYDIEVEAFPDQELRADATYNLGCFYATIGRTAEAVELVREALALRPGLRDWAARDPDLDAIRPLVLGDQPARQAADQ